MCPWAHRDSLPIWEYQEPAVLDQAAPVLNTWYTILDTTLNCRVIGVAVDIETTGEDLQVQITIDGETIQAVTETCAIATNYYAYVRPNAANQVDVCQISNADAVNARRAFLIEGRSVKIEVRKVTANGAGNLRGLAMYQILRRATGV